MLHSLWQSEGERTRFILKNHGDGFSGQSLKTKLISGGAILMGNEVIMKDAKKRILSLN